MIPSLCLEMVFTDRPFVARMAAAARLGYPAIEFWDWRDKDLAAIRQASGDLEVGVSAFSGNRDRTLVDPRERPALLDELRASLDVATRLGCRHLMLLTDRLLPDGSAAPVDGALSPAARLESVADALLAAGELVRGSGITLVLEPLNTRLDHRGYFLDRSAVAFDLVRRVGAPGVRVLYDVYHMATMGEDVAGALAAGFPWLGYVHVADTPGRHQPGTGTIDYAGVREALRRLGYAGPVGMEFSPAGPSEDAAREALALFALAGGGARP
jgi:hydroxypyruvate isomerase